MLLASAVAGSAQSESGSYYDPELLGQASSALQRGDTEKALSLYCAMLRPPARGELWTVSAVLLCDPSEISAAVAKIASPAPVFVQERDFEGRRCYRVCAGLTTSRNEASRWVLRLPGSLKPQGPFPVRVMVPCSERNAPEPPPSAPPASPPSPPKAPPGPGAGREFLGPPVKVPPGTPPANPSPEAKAVSPAAQDDAEAEAWFRKGLLAYQQGRRLDAYECYDRALTLEPDRPETLNNLGVLYLEEKRFAQAQPLFEKAVRLSPAYAAAHLNLAGALWGLKRFDDAVQEARMAAAMDPQEVNAELTLASFFLALGRNEEAAAAAKRALALDPKNERAQVFFEAAQTTHSAPEGRR